MNIRADFNNMLDKQPHVILTQEFVSQWKAYDEEIAETFMRTIRDVLADYQARIWCQWSVGILCEWLRVIATLIVLGSIRVCTFQLSGALINLSLEHMQTPEAFIDLFPWASVILQAFFTSLEHPGV